MSLASVINKGSSYLGFEAIPTLSKESDKQVIGIAGFESMAIVEEGKTLSSTSPDIVLEDGSTISDTIFIKPFTCTLSGSVSDVYIPDENEDNAITRANKLIGVTSIYLPSRTASQISRIQSLADDAQNIVRRAEKIYSDYQTILAQFGDKTEAKSLQEQFIQVLTAIHENKTLVPLEIMGTVYKDMHLHEISFTRKNNESREVLYKISAKQIRTAPIKFTRLDPASLAKVNASQGLGGATDNASDKGSTEGEPVEKSLASSLLGLF